jgi:hypothetical protein
VRRVSFWKVTPEHKFSMRPAWIMQNDDKIFTGMDKYQIHDYNKDTKNYGELPYKAKLAPKSSWTAPFVTGHKYRIRWGTKGINFEEMKVTMSQRWRNTDKPIHFTHQFTDVRAKYDIKING